MSEPTVEILQLKLNLHRKLFSLIKVSPKESEIIAAVVDIFWDHFPGHRVSYSEINAEEQMTVQHSREAPPLHSLKGFVFDLKRAPQYLAAMRRREVLAVEDIREASLFSPDFMPEALGRTGSVARLDCPIANEEGRIGVLSVTYPDRRVWLAGDIELIAEVAELVHLILREARAQEALKRSEGLFRQFAEHIRSVFWMSDPENKKSLYVSPAYDEIWGRPRTELETNPRAFLEAILPEDRSKVEDSLHKHFEGPYEKIYRIRQPSGAIRWIKDRSFPIHNERGVTYRVVGIAEDITPLHDAQERLQATQAQVISTAKFAALGEMASGIAHEINNPLAVIHGLSVQLQELGRERDPADPMMLDSLATIEKMAKRIAGIIKGLRTFSRQTDWDPMVPTDFNSILQETLAICDSKIQAANVILQTFIPDTPLKVSCRPAELSQVLVNLLNNAIDAVSQGWEKNIVFRVERRGALVVCSVEDSGPGVPPEIRERMFQPFFTTKEVGLGTGLGLSISKGIVEAHGGRLYLDSSSRRTKFVVELRAETK